MVVAEAVAAAEAGVLVAPVERLGQREQQVPPVHGITMASPHREKQTVLLVLAPAEGTTAMLARVVMAVPTRLHQRLAIMEAMLVLVAMAAGQDKMERMALLLAMIL